ncbi:MAG TPA: hypothetical protein VD704_03015 [Gaiellaceae bacterium]|nr:hypothetical protein [Gaiellaceae bacterium]
MRGRLARRQAALAAVALLGALGAIALSRLDDDDAESPPPTATVEWQEARVGVHAPSGEAGSCGQVVTDESVGVAHPVLPCGARLVLEHAGRREQAEVVVQGAVEAGRAFDVTPALARRLGIAGEATVRWRFAG